MSTGLKDLFFQGDFQQVLSLSWDHPGRRWKISDLSYILGAMCFLGRVDEAQLLFNKEKIRLSSEQAIACRFFLGIGFTRKGEYAQARALFARNRRTQGMVSFLSRFYIHQGLGFYRYFCGKWNLALRDSERAFEAALRSHFHYGRVLSADLRGHLLVQMGQIPRGLKTLRDAQTLALQMSNAELAKVIEISRVGYEAQFGLSPHETLSRLQKYIEAAASVQDTYSHSSLLLEMARQLLLRGKFHEASEILNQAVQQIYSHQNRRQEVTLNGRFAYLSLLTGDPARGLSFLQAAKRALDPRVDQALNLATLGLEQSAVGELGMKDKQLFIQKQVQEISKVYGGWVNKRILARWQIHPSDPAVGSQDRLGDIKDLLSTNRQRALEAIFEFGYLSLLLDIFPQFRGKQVLALDLDTDTLTTFGHRGIDHARGLTPLLRTVLKCLSQGVCGKAMLIEQVWKYKSYHPLHHDALIYQAMTALRKLLGHHADWIETTEDGYRLHRHVELFHNENLSPLKETLVVAQNPIDSTENKPELNHRQIRFLRNLKPKVFVNVQEYKDLFKVSEITASRDLSALHKFGFVVKVGKARATRYARTGGN